MIILRAACKNYIVRVEYDASVFTEDDLEKYQKELQDFCVFKEDEGLVKFTASLSAKFYNEFDSFEVINKHKNYGMTW